MDGQIARVTHTFSGTGPGWFVAEKNKLGPLVCGELVGVTTMLLTGASITAADLYVFDGQYDATELASSVPGDHLRRFEEAAVSTTASETDAVDNKRFAGEPFSEGLTPAMNLTGSGDWTAVMVLFVRVMQ